MRVAFFSIKTCFTNYVKHGTIFLNTAKKLDIKTGGSYKMKKKNFTAVDKLRDEIVAIHKEEPNALVQINHSAAIALDEFAKKERQTVAVLDVQHSKRRVKVLSIAYEGKLQDFEEGGKNQKRYIFILQQKEKERDDV